MSSRRSSSSSSSLPVPLGARRFSVAWPLLIILAAMIFSSGRNVIALHRQKTQVLRENGIASDLMKKSADQAQYVEALRLDLVNLAVTNPNVARVLNDFFPPKATRKASAGEDPLPRKVPSGNPAPQR